MNVTSMSERLRRRLGSNANDGLFTPDRLMDLLDEANQMLEAERDWPWRLTEATFATTPGVHEYAAAAFAPAGDWLRTAELSIDGFGPLIERGYFDLGTRNSAGWQGQPSEFAFYGDTLLLSPVPDGVVTITHRYVKVPPALTGGSDRPLMPAMFHWAIVHQAAALALNNSGQDDRAVVAEAEVQRWRERMLDDLRRTKGPIRTRVRPGSAL